MPEALEDLLERVRPRSSTWSPRSRTPPARCSRRPAAAASPSSPRATRVPLVEDLALRHLPLDDGPLPAPIAAARAGGSSISDRLGQQGAVGRASDGLDPRRPPGRRAPDAPEDRRRHGQPAAVAAPGLLAAAAHGRGRGGAAPRSSSRATAPSPPPWASTCPTGPGTPLAAAAPSGSGMPGGDARAFGQVAQRCGVNVVPGQVLSAEGAPRRPAAPALRARPRGHRRGRPPPRRGLGALRRHRIAPPGAGQPDRVAAAHAGAAEALRRRGLGREPPLQHRHRLAPSTTRSPRTSTRTIPPRAEAWWQTSRVAPEPRRPRTAPGRSAPSR